MTKYITGNYGKLIEPIEVQKETEESVWINGRRHAKRSGWHNYFDTFAEAKELLTNKAQKKHDELVELLESARVHLESVKALQP